jgi:hypothetical protein
VLSTQGLDEPLMDGVGRDCTETDLLSVPIQPVLLLVCVMLTLPLPVLFHVTETELDVLLPTMVPFVALQE